MGRYTYTDDEQRLLKVMKMNQDDSLALLNDSEMAATRNDADASIAKSTAVLKRLRRNPILPAEINHKAETKIQMRDFESIAKEAEEKYREREIEIEDLLSEREMQNAYNNLDKINKEFSSKTSIINKTDLIFLAVATALQTAKVLLMPTIGKELGYGEKFDKRERLDHNDKSIKQAHRQANDKFRDKNIEKHGKGKWINIVYQTPPYDVTRGSPSIGFNMEGGYHRMHTLGHDPVMGWIFGTANILTDTISLRDMRTFKVTRNPMMITPNRVPTPKMFMKCKQMVHDDFLNLPAALFAQYRHLKSDEFTKYGLPVPMINTFTPEFAGDLYKSQYDALCLARDAKIVGVSFTVSALIDMIIGLVHGLYYNSSKNPNRKLYDVRTRKILLISSSIASASSIVYASITKNPKNLDLGALLLTATKLFTDIRFFARIKQEYIESELNRQLLEEMEELDEMMKDFQ